MRDLSTLTTPELEEFFNSFDRILSDIDGVFWTAFENVPGVNDAIKSIKKLNKQIVLVTNNTTRSRDYLHERLQKAGYDIEKNNIITPTEAMVSYLLKRGFDGRRVLVLGTAPVKEALKEVGFKIEESLPQAIRESYPEFASQSEDNGTVDIVIVDIDINLNYLNLQKAASILERPETLFLAGASDVTIPVDENRIMIGPGVFVDILETITGRKCIRIGKPYRQLNEYITDKYKIDDPSKVLFIGDSIPVDMGFAANCGYRKLLVLSGLSNKSSVENWTDAQHLKPDFYVDSLKTVHECLVRVYGKHI